MIVGDSAGFLNSARLKGIHLAIKSGMLAAETAFEALVKSDAVSSATLGKFQRRVETSWIYDELWPVRNFHQGFKNGMVAGMFNTVLQEIFPGGLRNRVPSHAGYENLQPIANLPADGGPEAHMLGPAKGDGKLTFDKLTDLYHSGTKHEEDQPAHLRDPRYQYLQ